MFLPCLSLAAALTGAVLRVQADPNSLPFTNAQEEGFENRVLAVLAGDLHAKVEYHWRAQRRGFFRAAFGADHCDLVAGVPVDFDAALTTIPYYESGYAVVTRASAAKIHSLHDPALRRMRLGIEIIGDGEATPPGLLLAQLGLTAQVRGYSVYGDYSKPSPAHQIMTAVAQGDVDAAFVWGPLAGFFATREGAPLAVTLLPESDATPTIKLRFPMAIGVRKDEPELRDALNRAIEAHRRDIDRILAAYGVPLYPERTTEGGAP